MYLEQWQLVQAEHFVNFTFFCSVEGVEEKESFLLYYCLLTIIYLFYIE